MAVLITDEDLTQFLPTEKLAATDVPEHTRNTSQEIVLARLRSAEFPVQLWVSDATTPLLVRTIIAMHAAGVYYSAAFSEDDTDDNGYGAGLQARALSLLDMLISGSLELDAIAMPVDHRTLESAGTLITEPVFTMGQIF